MLRSQYISTVGTKTSLGYRGNFRAFFAQSITFTQTTGNKSINFVVKWGLGEG